MKRSLVYAIIGFIAVGVIGGLFAYLAGLRPISATFYIVGYGLTGAGIGAMVGHLR